MNIKYPVLYQILVKTDVQTIYNLSRTCKEYEFLKDFSICDKCRKLRKISKGLFYYLLDNSYFRPNEIRHHKVKMSNILYYCQGCFIDIIFNYSGFKCKICNCYYDNLAIDDQNILKALDTPSRSDMDQVVTNNGIHNFLSWPDEYQYLRNKDQICRKCLKLLMEKNIVSQHNDDYLSLCSVCKITNNIDDPYYRHRGHYENAVFCSICDNWLDTENYFVVIGKNILRKNPSNICKLKNNCNLPLNSVICDNCIISYDYELREYYECERCMHPILKKPHSKRLE